MRTRLLPLVLALPLIGKAQLSGTYIIDPSGNGDYTTLELAEVDLFANGVSGPTTFAFVDGLHYETVYIRPYAGASTTNRVTITSQSGNAAAVTLQATGNITVGHASLNITAGAGHVTITDLTIITSEDGISISDAEDVRVERCVLEGVGVDNREYGISCEDTDNAVFIGNTVTGFRHGIQFHGDAATYAIGAEIRENTIVSGVERAQGISVIYAEDVVIEGNHADLLAPIPLVLYYSHGVTLLDVNGPVVVSRNIITHGTGGSGMMITRVTGTLAEPTRIENNMVLLTQGNNTDQVSVGISYSEHVKINHNTFRASLVGAEAAGMSYLTHAELQGNIFSAEHTQAAGLSEYTFTDVVSDRNLFHCTSAFPIGTYDPILMQRVSLTLAQWQALGWDPGSITGDPHFVSSTDLHITTSSAAAGLAPNPPLVAEDVDGEPRPGPVFPMVEAGADELDVCAPFRGTYVIGSSPMAHYATFNEVRTALYSCGVGAPVVFEVEPGTYTETLMWDTPITGASTLNTITFRGQTLDSTDVTLTWPSAMAQRVFTFKDADHLFFEHMTFQRGNANGSEIVWVDNGGAAATFNCGFRNCRFLGNAIANPYSIMVRNVSGDAQGAMYFERCAFVQGYEAIKWNGAAFEYLRIAHCTFETWTLDAVNVTGMGTGLEIEDNRFTNNAASPGVGLKVASGNGAFRVERNRFVMSGSGTGGGTIIHLDNCVSPVGSRGRVVNNMLIAWDRVNVNGIHITNACRRIDVLNNSVSVKNSVNTGAALVIATSATGSGCEISNNIFHSRTSYAVHNSGAVALGTLKRNLLHTTYLFLAHWGGARVDLAALQAASGQFNNSIQAPPLFLNNASNLHIQTTSPAVAAGFAFSSVINDYDLQTRPLPAATNPDIGADEIDQSAPFAPRAPEEATEENEPAFHLYPNPANSTVQWNALPARAERIELFDATGRSVRAVNAQDGILSVDDLPAGTYQALVIGTGAVLASSRLVILH